MTNTFTLEHSDLTTACAMLARVINKKTAAPILASVLFDGRGNVTATDLDIELTYRLDGTFDHEPFTVELAQLAKIIKGANKGALVKMSYDKESGTVAILSDGLESCEDALPADDFPIWNEHYGKAQFFDVSESALHDALSFVAPCMDDLTRYYLRGVHLTQYRNSLTMVATNGHQLAELETGLPLTSDEDSPMGEGRGVIVPDKAVKVALASIGAKGGDSLVALRVQELCVTFGARKWSMRCSPVKGTFPDWTRIMPKESGAWVELDRADLLKATTRLAGVCDNPALQLKCDDDSATLSSDGGKRTMSLKVKRGGDAVEIAFDHKYLTSACKAFSSDLLHVSTSEAGSPAAFTSDGDRARVRVVMPMRY